MNNTCEGCVNRTTKWDEKEKEFKDYCGVSKKFIEVVPVYCNGRVAQLEGGT